MVTKAAPAKLALGAAQWGMAYGIANKVGPPEDEELRALLGTASKGGVDTIDTARAYGNSEVRIGRCLGDDPRWRVYTKLAVDAWQDGFTCEQAATAARLSLDASRAALQRQPLDGVLLHRAAQRSLAGGTIWSVLRQEVEQGRIGRIGISAAQPDEAREALGDPTVRVIQIACNLLDQRFLRSGLLDSAVRSRRTVLVRSIFLQGVAHLMPSDLPAHLTPLREVLVDISSWGARHGLRLPEVFLGFGHLLRGATILIGCERADQLAENLTVWERTRGLTDELHALANSLPTFSERLINPASWPTVA